MRAAHRRENHDQPMDHAPPCRSDAERLCNRDGAGGCHPLSCRQRTGGRNHSAGAGDRQRRIGIEYRTYANAVAAALTRSGFAVADAGRPAALTATIAYDVAIQRPYDRRGSPVSVGVGGSTGSYGSGLGVGIGIDLSGPPKAVIATRLSVRISRGAAAEPVWEGRAETAAKEGTPGAQPAIAAGKLADAMFRDYPGQSGATITVK